MSSSKNASSGWVADEGRGEALIHPSMEASVLITRLEADGGGQAYEASKSYNQGGKYAPEQTAKQTHKKPDKQKAPNETKAARTDRGSDAAAVQHLLHGNKSKK